MNILKLSMCWSESEFPALTELLMNELQTIVQLIPFPLPLLFLSHLKNTLYTSEK